MNYIHSLDEKIEKILIEFKGEPCQLIYDNYYKLLSKSRHQELNIIDYLKNKVKLKLENCDAFSITGYKEFVSGQLVENFKNEIIPEDLKSYYSEKFPIKDCYERIELEIKGDNFHFPKTKDLCNCYMYMENREIDVLFIPVSEVTLKREGIDLNEIAFIHEIKKNKHKYFSGFSNDVIIDYPEQFECLISFGGGALSPKSLPSQISSCIRDRNDPIIKIPIENAHIFKVKNYNGSGLFKYFRSAYITRTIIIVDPTHINNLAEVKAFKTVIKNEKALDELRSMPDFNENLLINLGDVTKLYIEPLGIGYPKLKTCMKKPNRPVV